MKRIIPVIVVFILIAIIMVAGPGRDLIESLRYSDETADMSRHFNLESDEEAAIIMDNAVLEEKGIYRYDHYYLPLSLVKERFNKHFYLDTREALLLYTVPETVYAANIDGSFYYEYGTTGGGTDTGAPICFLDGDTAYISLDYVKEFTNLQADTYKEPYRLELDNTYEERTVADIKKDTAIRYQGGVKSPILTEVESGEEVVVLEEMETWTKVKYKAIIGYVENKRLGEQSEDKPQPVTTVPETVYPHNSLGQKVCLGWHQVASAESAFSSFDSLAGKAKGMNVISPTWFSLSDNEGNFTNLSSTRYVSMAHERGMQVWGLIDNFNTQISSLEILSRTSVRNRLVENLMQAAAACGMDGINIDFEQLNTECEEHFAQFIRELSVACHREGIILSVDNYVPQGGTDHYRRDVQGEFSDYIIIMGYDEHWAGSGVPGSVASIGYVDTGIALTLRQAPPERIINGIPFYTRVWTTTDAGVEDQALGMSDARAFINKNNIQMSWDDSIGQNYGQFQSGNKLYQIWMEDEKSIAAKLDLMTNYNLAGVAIWKLGFEGPEVWDVIDGYLHG